MEIRKKIRIDMARKGFPQRVECVQYDTGTVLEADLEGFVIPEEATAAVFVEKPSKKVVYQQAEIIDGKIEVKLKSQALAEHGIAPAQFRISKDGDLITTFAILLLIEKSYASDSAEESKNVIDGFENEIRKALEGFGVDPTLKKQGYAAEAQKTGEKIGILNDGVKETGVISMYGKPVKIDGYMSGSTWTNRTGYYSALLPVKSGQKIKVKNPEGKSSVIACFKSTQETEDGITVALASGWTGSRTIGTSTRVEESEFTIPEDGKILAVYLGIGNDLNRAPQMLQIDGYDQTRNAFENILNLSGKITNLEEAPTRIRIMQNNVGHFNRGKAVTNKTVEYLTDANAKAVMDAYKKMFGHHKPDILGIEEYEDIRYFGAYESTGFNVSHEIHDKMFENKSVVSGSASRCVTFAKHEILDSAVVVLTIDSGEYIRGVYSHVKVGNKTLAVFNTAMLTGTGAAKMASRKELYRKIIDHMAQDERAVIVCDANNSGTANDTTLQNSKNEIESILAEVMKPEGWNAAMGDYFSPEKTYKSTDTNYIAAIDNIFYKDNGKIKLDNFEVLSELYDALISDHIPVIADFRIL